MSQVRLEEKFPFRSHSRSLVSQFEKFSNYFSPGFLIIIHFEWLDGERSYPISS